LVITDTETHADYLHSLLGIDRSKIKTIYVGAEKIFHRPATPSSDHKKPLNIFFFGQIAPLHGFGTIASAALQLKDRHDIAWTIAGGAPSDPDVQQLLTNLSPEQLTYQQWLDYDALVERICRSDVCLGVFGDSPKTQRVIPNKVFQVLATGCPIITAHTPAIEELLNQDIHPRIMEIAASNPDQLVAAITCFVEKKQRGELAQPEPIDFTPLVLKQFRETFLT
jgi:glycosyltransferase involved in cell wall biosynthesis